MADAKMIKSASKIQSDIDFVESEVWTAGEDGLETFYIYGLLAANKTIFAFSEGRIERHDKSAHHIVLKKSTDNGKTWSKNQFIVKSQNGECFCNPTPIFERQTGMIFLFYGQNFENNRSELYLISSSDDGENWSAPQNLTYLFDNNLDDWTLHLPGPGHGLQTKDGKLLLQIWHRRPITFPVEERRYGISVIYSDDFGESWKNGGIIPIENAPINESRIVELENGELLLNARCGAFTTSPRYFSSSFDKGENWSEPEAVTSLPTAFATDSGFVNFQQNEQDLLILTRPNNEQLRKNLTVYLSDNKGKSWNYSKSIYKDFAGYSDAVILSDGNIGVIYGRDLLDENGDVEGNVKQTMFVCFNLNYLRF